MDRLYNYVCIKNYVLNCIYILVNIDNMIVDRYVVHINNKHIYFVYDINICGGLVVGLRYSLILACFHLLIIL